MVENYKTTSLLVWLQFLVIISYFLTGAQASVSIDGQCNWADPYAIRHRNCYTACEEEGHPGGYCGGIMATTCWCSRSINQKVTNKKIIDEYSYFFYIFVNPIIESITFEGKIF